MKKTSHHFHLPQSVLFRVFFVILWNWPCFGSAAAAEERDTTQYVNPFIGTQGFGHTFPGATYPLGLVQLSPDSGNGSWDYCAGYQYTDTTLHGFSHTHASGGGTGDFGDILVLPFVSEPILEREQAYHDKQAETASPGYYSTVLSADQVHVELSATERTGIHRYTYLKGGQKQMLINISRILYSWGTAERGQTYDAEFEILNDRRIHGGYYSDGKARRDVHFSIEFDQPFVNHRFLEGSEKNKLVLDFGPGRPGDEVVMRTGLSTVRPEGARKNLEAENLGHTFEEIREAARLAWNRQLSRIRIEADPDDLVQFYTAMYQFYIQPNNIADVDGRYRGADEGIYRSESGQQYAMLALWDVFRTAFPLHTILNPEKHGQFMQALLDHYDQAGFLPVWGIWGKTSSTMIGNHGTTVLWDAIQKEIPGIDKEHAYEAMKATLTRNHWRKYDWSQYDPYGYFPEDKVTVESVSRTLEACLNDWCAAQLAKALGKEEDYRFFLKRSRFYQNLFNPETVFFQPKFSDGSWMVPFDPMQNYHAGSANGPYTEGSAWQYLWSVQHDLEDLAALMGGPFYLGKRLDTLFELPSIVYSKGKSSDTQGLVGQYVHGNEPTHHTIYLYNYANRPDRTQLLVQKMLDEMYLNQPDGLSGNDDFGQMSAWYVMSSLGFYPANPVSGVYDIGVPFQAYAEVDLGGTDNTLVVRREPFTEAMRFVRRVTLNGKELEDLKITHEQVMAGGELVFEMSELPQPRSLFNGKDLTQWDGDPEYWSVEDGAITGRSEAHNLLEKNSFLVWKGGKVRDFILTLKARQKGNNSGIQYRGRMAPEVAKWAVGGYQCDIHPETAFDGMLYEQYGRETLAQNGHTVMAVPGGLTWLMKTHEPVDADPAEWNEYQIIARGNHLIHKLNGEVTVDYTDFDRDARAEEGIIALQLHYGPAMEVQFKDIELQDLPPVEIDDNQRITLPAEARLIEYE